MEKKCKLCHKIPDYLTVDTFNTGNQLPQAVGQLLNLSQNVRKCPECKNYFEYTHDHDSEAPFGPGYTDESIRRIPDSETKNWLKRNWEENERLIDFFTARKGSWGDEMLKRVQLDKKNLEKELEGL